MKHRPFIHQGLIVIIILVLLIAILPAGESRASELYHPEGLMAPDTSPPQYLTDEIVIPEPLPLWTPPLNTPNFTNQLIEYDTATKTEKLSPYQTTVVDSPPGQDTFSIPTPNTLEDQLLRSFGTLTEVTNPENWPNSASVKVIVSWPSGDIFTHCSGVLVDDQHILTAGHCLYTFDADRCLGEDTSCWCTDVKVIPGYKLGDEPLGAVRKSPNPILGWTAWTEDHNYDFDIMAVELMYPIGAISGNYTFSYNSMDDFFHNNPFTNDGYPAEDPYDGERMYTWSGAFDLVWTDILYHYNYSYGGQSGSGTFTYINPNYVTYAILSHGNVSPTRTGHTRITQFKYNAIHDWIVSHEATAFDLVAMNLRVDDNYFDRGDQLFGLDFLIHNASDFSMPTTTYDFSLWLSTNWSISPADTLLASSNFDYTFNPHSGVRIVIPSPPYLPLDCSYADQDYYVGLTLDYTDADTSNNDASYYQVHPIHINACDLYEPDDTWETATEFGWPYTQQHNIVPANDQDWIYFDLDSLSEVTLETSHGNGSGVEDTIITLYDESMELVEFDDDSGNDLFSRIDRTCTEDPLPSGRYYLLVQDYGQDSKITGYILSYESDPCLTNHNFLPMIIK